jgi:hypothetical protein
MRKTIFIPKSFLHFLSLGELPRDRVLIFSHEVHLKSEKPFPENIDPYGAH